MNPDTIRVVGPPFALVIAQVLTVCGPPGTETFKAPLFRGGRRTRCWDFDRLARVICEYDHCVAFPWAIDAPRQPSQTLNLSSIFMVSRFLGPTGWGPSFARCGARRQKPPPPLLAPPLFSNGHFLPIRNCLGCSVSLPCPLPQLLSLVAVSMFDQVDSGWVRAWIYLSRHETELG
jgi:hypothetical protein